VQPNEVDTLLTKCSYSRAQRGQVNHMRSHSMEWAFEPRAMVNHHSMVTMFYLFCKISPGSAAQVPCQGWA
jgi:hypothetical protein